MFSKDQRSRMRACLYHLRKELVSPSNHVFTGVDCDDLRKNCNSCPASPLTSTEPGYKDLQLNKAALETKIALSPNPVRDIVHITYNGLAIHNISIVVYNQKGQKLREVHSNAAINELSFGSFSEGVYYISITIDNRSITKYLIKGSL